MLLERVELVGVDPDRANDDVGAAAVVDEALALDVPLGARDRQAGLDEVAAPAVRVEADHVVREQALVHGAPHVLGQHVPVVALGPRDVDELQQAGVGASLAHVAGRDVEVVVVEEDLGVGVAVELGQHHVGERAVHPLVAVPPGDAERRLDVGHRREAPEVVLDEPEGAVGDGVVVAVVGELVVRDEAQPVGHVVARSPRSARRRAPSPRRGPRRSSRSRSTSRRDGRSARAAP